MLGLIYETTSMKAVGNGKVVGSGIKRVSGEINWMFI